MEKWGRDMNRQFMSRQDTENGSQPCEICEIMCKLVIGEMQIKTTLKYRFSPVKLTKIK